MDQFPPAILEKILQLPAGRPPPGVKPNFLNPPSISGVGYMDIILCLVLATLSFSMKLYTTAFVIRKFYIEDYLLILGFCFNAALGGTTLNVIHQGLYHQWDIKARDVIFYLYWFRIIAILYCVAICLVRIVIILQYLRLFVVNNQRGFMFWACHLLIWTNAMWYTVSVMIESLPCDPIELAWDPIHAVIGGGSCLDVNKERLVKACFNVFSDFAVLLLPHHVIWKLQLSTTKKIGISAMFAIGTLACATSIARLYFTYQLLVMNPLDDQIRAATYVGLFLNPEVVCGILVATLPILPRFIQHLREGRNGSSSSSEFGRSFSISSKTTDASWKSRDINRPPYADSKNTIEFDIKEIDSRSPPLRRRRSDEETLFDEYSGPLYEAARF